MLGRPPGGGAAHRELVEKLRKRLMAGEWPLRSYLPSQRQFASEYKVGDQVVRLALKVMEKEGRVIAMPRRGFQVNERWDVLSATRNLIAIVLANPLQTHFTQPYVQAMHRGLESALALQGNPFLTLHGRQERLRFEIPPDLMDIPLRGVLLIGPFRKKALAAYEKLPMPVVLLDRPPENFQLCSVSVDNEQATYDAVNRLLQAGHRRIAFIRVLNLKMREIDPDSKERQLGFLRALKEAGLGRPRDAIFNVYWKKGTQYEGIRSMLRSRPKFSAAVAVDASVAVRIQRMCSEEGIVIPRDLSVVAFQDKDEPGDWTGPQTDFFELGRRAAMITQEKRFVFRQERLAPDWKEGKTLTRLKGT